MLNRLIKFSLDNRLLVVSSAALIFVYGLFTLTKLPVDVLPDLNRPRVTIFLEANGMAPEEIETQVNFPVETQLNGAPGVEVVRSVATSGLGMIFVEFDWNTDVYLARQLTAERIQSIELPNGITPQMGPISSIMGQVMMIAVTADTTSASDLRTICDFTIRRRLMGVRGVSQVIPIGGEKLQYQILLSPEKLLRHQLSIDDVYTALQSSNLNTTGGFIDHQGSELLIRTTGRINNLSDIKKTVIKSTNGYPITVDQIATVTFGGAMKRGDGSYNGRPAVILNIEKQPGANTVTLTDDLLQAIEDLKRSLPSDVKIQTEVFQQKSFIVSAIRNVELALRDGFILIVIILFLFLLNFRTTVITLTAIPLSLIITAIVFKFFDISINTLTLGGLAIAIGELVDDAIVDVENVYRRLKENWNSAQPKPLIQVIYDASSEVRNSIVYATIIVVLVFIPLFYLQGVEGRIFAPLGIAYITSILASLVVSLTVTPALCSYLLKTSDHLSSLKWSKNKSESGLHRDSPLVRWLKAKDKILLGWGLTHPKAVLGSAIILIVLSVSLIPFFGTEFLPPFNEGSYTINLSTPAGTSLKESNYIGTLAEKQLLKVPEVQSVSRRTGRAELDEHAEPPSNSEIDVSLKPEGPDGRSKEKVLEDMRNKLSILKGVNINIGQPISHRLDHLLSGVRAQISMKIFGNDLIELRASAKSLAKVIEDIDGVVDVQVENQIMTPQLKIDIHRDALAQYGLNTGKIAEDLELFYNGKVISQVFDGQKSFDILLRTDDESRMNLEKIKNTPIATSDGGLIPLYKIATIEKDYLINVVYHENTQRRIVISANVQGRDLGSTVQEMQQKVNEQVKLPEGNFLQWGGQYQSQQSASRLIFILSLFSFLGIFLVLYSHFKSMTISLQIMLNVPLALVGSVIAVLWTGGVFSIATLVGFITLTGIASRNGIMMISHYIHLVQYENESFDDKMIIRGSLERLVPVLMTALVAALALIPLTLDPHAPGKEILYPVATVILGGLVSSTLLDMIVTPVVFKQFGRKAVEAYIQRSNSTSLEK